MTPATAAMGRTGAGRTGAGSIGALGRMGIVPVVVIDDADRAAPLAEALLEAGIAGAEVTLRTPAALGALAVMTRYPGFVAASRFPHSPCRWWTRSEQVTRSRPDIWPTGWPGSPLRLGCAPR